MQALGSAEKVIEIIERLPEISLDEGYIAAVDIEGCIVFDDVTFSYPARPNQYILQACITDFRKLVHQNLLDEYSVFKKEENHIPGEGRI